MFKYYVIWIFLLVLTSCSFYKDNETVTISNKIDTSIIKNTLSNQLYNSINWTIKKYYINDIDKLDYKLKSDLIYQNLSWTFSLSWTSCLSWYNLFWDVFLDLDYVLDEEKYIIWLDLEKLFSWNLLFLKPINLDYDITESKYKNILFLSTILGDDWLKLDTDYLKNFTYTEFFNEIINQLLALNTNKANWILKNMKIEQISNEEFNFDIKKFRFWNYFSWNVHWNIIYSNNAIQTFDFILEDLKVNKNILSWKFTFDNFWLTVNLIINDINDDNDDMSIQIKLFDKFIRIKIKCYYSDVPYSEINLWFENILSDKYKFYINFDNFDSVLNMDWEYSLSNCNSNLPKADWFKSIENLFDWY